MKNKIHKRFNFNPFRVTHEIYHLQALVLLIWINLKNENDQKFKQ